jgi:hypothetical protein
MRGGLEISDSRTRICGAGCGLMSLPLFRASLASLADIGKSGVRMSGPKRPRTSSQVYFFVFLATAADLVFAAVFLRAGAFFLAAAFGAAFAFAAVLGFAFAVVFLVFVAFFVGIAMGTPLR